MSVSQVKKRFSEFETYLGRDKEALRRLKLLKDDVNVLRTSLAAAEEKAELAEVVKNAARERADKAEAEADELRIENQRLRGQAAVLMSDLASATKPEANPVDDDDPERLVELGEYADARRTIKALRKVMPHCPKAQDALKYNFARGSSPLLFIRQAISDGWSHTAIWKLGASVAIIAAENGRITIADPVGISQFGKKQANKIGGFAFNFLHWFDKNHDTIKERSETKTRFKVRLRGDQPGDEERTTAFLYGAQEEE